MRWAYLLVLWAGAAAAQGVLVRSSSTPSPNRDDVAVRYTASATTGTAFGCNAQIASCLDAGPGANDAIGTDSSGRLLLGTGSSTATVCIGEDLNICFSENGNISVANGAVILNTGTGIYNQTAGKAIPMDAAFGVNIGAKALGTCSSTHEGDLVRDSAAGGTSGARTRLCLCTSDGGGPAAYTWVNAGCPSTAGTSTTCPACP